MSNHYIELADGLKWHFDSDDNEISIETIAHSLSGITRYTGHAGRMHGCTYTVAEHSVKASWIDPTLETLMHDAAEAVVGDMSSPLKGYLRSLARVAPMGSQLSDYDLVEEEVCSQIFRQHGIPKQTPATKYADVLMAVIEAEHILPTKGAEWGFITDELRIDAWAAVKRMPRIAPSCWPPSLAKSMFIERFYELRHGHIDDVKKRA